VSNFDQTAPRVCAALAAAGGLQFPDSMQRHQAIISLGTLFSLAAATKARVVASAIANK
jgi:hypothetical protein